MAYMNLIHRKNKYGLEASRFGSERTDKLKLAGLTGPGERAWIELKLRAFLRLKFYKNKFFGFANKEALNFEEK